LRLRCRRGSRLRASRLKIPSLRSQRIPGTTELDLTNSSFQTDLPYQGNISGSESGDLRKPNFSFDGSTAYPFSYEFSDNQSQVLYEEGVVGANPSSNVQQSIYCGSFGLEDANYVIARGSDTSHNFSSSQKLRQGGEAPAEPNGFLEVEVEDDFGSGWNPSCPDYFMNPAIEDIFDFAAQPFQGSQTLSPVLPDQTLLSPAPCNSPASSIHPPGKSSPKISSSSPQYRATDPQPPPAARDPLYRAAIWSLAGPFQIPSNTV